MSGWIKIHRKFDNWGWRDNPQMVSLFLYMLTQANFEKTIWHGIEIERGQVIFGFLKWAETLGISVQSLRTCIERLKSTHEITTKPTNKFTIITIVKYEDYQQIEEISTYIPTHDSTNNQQTTNIQSTTPKELKKEKKGGTMPFSEIPIDWRQFAIEQKGWDDSIIAIVWETFREYWQDGKGKNVKREDWTATYKKWILKENIYRNKPKIENNQPMSAAEKDRQARQGARIIT